MATGETLSGRRRRIVEAARSVDGLEAGRDRDAFKRALGVPPAEGWDGMLDVPFSLTRDAEGHYRTTGVSTCALVAREILRRAGLDNPHAEEPYRPGMAGVELSELALRSHAYHVRDGYRVRPGDVFILGTTGANQHVATIVDVSGDVATSVDGGLVAEDKLQRIGQRERSARMLGEQALIIDVDLLPWT